MVSTLDSLVDLIRLERELERGGPDPDARKEEPSWTPNKEA